MISRTVEAQLRASYERRRLMAKPGGSAAGRSNTAMAEQGWSLPGTAERIRMKKPQRPGDWRPCVASIPNGESPVPENQSPGEPTAAGALASRPEETQPSRPPEGLAAAASAHHDDRPRSRRLPKKILRPVILAALGGVLFIVALILYPSPSESPTPSYVTIETTSTVSVGIIGYQVSQVTPSIAKVVIEIILPTGVTYPPGEAPVLKLSLYLPPGTAFRTCPSDFCTLLGGNYYQWAETLDFSSETPGGGTSSGEAIATFFVRAHSFGYGTDGINASAAIPQVFYQGPGSPALEVAYFNATSADSYDWSAFPAEEVNANLAFWDEPLTSGVAPGRVAVGIDHASETRANNETFIAGALIGLAGGALLSAVQEALHANDNSAPENSPAA